jgi:L-alanine-DL-glutamate epimerase-like enolase superfamily enzyme
VLPAPEESRSGFNGPKFLDDLLVEGLRAQGNAVTVSDGPGLGTKVKEANIRARAVRL